MRSLPAVALAVALSVGCALGSLGRGRPELASAGPAAGEESLRAAFDRMEAELAASGRRVRDRELETHVHDLACRLSPPQCREVRVYVLHTPDVHASMAPSGMLLVSTGFLLRVRDEAELAFVIGHELGHLGERHGIEEWHEAHAHADTLSTYEVLGGLAGGLIGAGVFSVGGDVVSLAQIRAYSREQEREADRIGVESMVRAGHDPHRAAALMERVLEESPEGSRSWFFETHPSTAERAATLRALAESSNVPADGASGPPAWALARRARWLRDQLRTGDFETAQHLLTGLLQTGVGAAELHFFQGELHRLRAGPDDAARATAAYEQALRLPGAPAETERGLALVRLHAGETTRAREAFTRYLERRPEAEDGELIRAWLASPE